MERTEENQGGYRKDILGDMLGEFPAAVVFGARLACCVRACIFVGGRSETAEIGVTVSGLLGVVVIQSLFWLA